MCVLQLFWSILLLCLGRHPSQNPHHFTPDIGQVPRSVVDKLPLVYYIPPPPDQPSKPVTLPSDLHSYPPKPPPDSRRRFRLFTRRNGSGGKSSSSSSRGGGGTTKSGAGKGKGKGSNKRPLTWEDNWERGAYPFVQLDGHRASCAICLLDFQEPKRVSEGALKTAEADRPDSSDAQTQGGPNDAAAAAAEEEEEAEADTEADNEAGGRGEEVEEVGEVTELTTTTATPPLSPSGDNSHNLRLQDAGQGAQPLRLLKCGHVFHVSLSRLTWERVLHVLTPNRKHAWTRGSSMSRAAVLCVSDLYVEPSPKRRQQVRAKIRVQRVGSGSEETDGEDLRKKMYDHFTTAFACSTCFTFTFFWVS